MRIADADHHSSFRSGDRMESISAAATTPTSSSRGYLRSTRYKPRARQIAANDITSTETPAITAERGGRPFTAESRSGRNTSDVNVEKLTNPSAPRKIQSLKRSD